MGKFLITILPGVLIIAKDICEYCWDARCKDTKGLDLRKINGILSKNKSLTLKNIELIRKIQKFKSYAIE